MLDILFWINYIKYNYQGRAVYYGDLRGNIRLYDTRVKQVNDLITLEERARVDSFHECLDSNYLVSGFSDGRVSIYCFMIRKILNLQDVGFSDINVRLKNENICFELRGAQE